MSNQKNHVVSVAFDPAQFRELRELVFRGGHPTSAAAIRAAVTTALAAARAEAKPPLALVPPQPLAAGPPQPAPLEPPAPAPAPMPWDAPGGQP